MAIDVQQVLAEAYDLAQVRQDRAGAVALLKKTMGDEPAAAELRQEMGRLSGVVARGGPGMDCGCHVSRVLYELLTTAYGVSPSGAAAAGQTALIYDIVSRALT